MNENDFDLEKWVEIIKKHYTTMRGFHPETYEITLGDIEATARFFYDLGLKRTMEENPTLQNLVSDNVPELRKSDDEKVKEALIDLVLENIGQGVMNHNNVDCNDMVVWLENL